MSDHHVPNTLGIAQPGNPAEVFSVFLRLGLTSFGGPIAHLGYFREAFVVRRRWLDEASYGDLVALCQFLPGPASSQVGFAIGLQRAGALGALAAWTAFTLPSALLLFAFAQSAAAFAGPVGTALIHGLKLVAVAIVAQAVWGMAKGLTPDRPRAAIALAALGIVTLGSSAVSQIGAIVAGATIGWWLCREAQPVPSSSFVFRVPRWVGVVSLGVFAVLLAGLPLAVAASDTQGLALFDAFYRSGALVFGGGHVVLPLLDGAVVQPGWTTQSEFLAGYGAVQAVPGPLFTFAAYLGAIVRPEPNGIIGAAIATVAVFLPGFLILVGTLPFWNDLRVRPGAQAALRGANAAVVGLLGAAFYDPVWTSAVLTPIDFAIAAAGFVALVRFAAPPWTVVLGITAAATVAALV